MLQYCRERISVFIDQLGKDVALQRLLSPNLLTKHGFLLLTTHHSHPHHIFDELPPKQLAQL